MYLEYPRATADGVVDLEDVGTIDVETYTYDDAYPVELLGQIGYETGYANAYWSGWCVRPFCQRYSCCCKCVVCFSAHL